MFLASSCRITLFSVDALSTAFRMMRHLVCGSYRNMHSGNILTNSHTRLCIIAFCSSFRILLGHGFRAQSEIGAMGANLECILDRCRIDIKFTVVTCEAAYVESREFPR